MGFLADLLQRLKGGSSQSGPRPQVGFTTDDGQALWIYLECENCGEHIKLRLRKTSEIQRREGLDREEGPGEFFIRKTIIGSRCYRPLEAEIEFDRRYQVIASKVKNGRLIPRSEYKGEQ